MDLEMTHSEEKRWHSIVIKLLQKMDQNTRKGFNLEQDGWRRSLILSTCLLDFFLLYFNVR